ncbi:repressor of RNA polymerase III transcription MAF1 [Salvia divinorum]|uniref:Repressor of RNA polymerase III transcription n=2 Tax=Salvia divinorum TaxID=28513 RepID=A0ABD1FJ97_SALDI
MKYMTDIILLTPLNRINIFLRHLTIERRTIKGSLDAYSCKHAGTDKKLSLSLENELLDHLGKSLDTESSSPDEYLIRRSSRKTLIYLLLTLHQMYPDCYFSAARTHEFFTEESWDSFKQIFDVYMLEASQEWSRENEGDSLPETLHKALDEVVKVSECEIYSYNPNSDEDPFLEGGAIWSYNFFFYNKKLKRVVSFRFGCLSAVAIKEFQLGEPSLEEDEDIFDDMDIW